MVSIGMIETWSQWLTFLTDSVEDDLLLHIVPLHDGVHYAINTPSILFIKNLQKGRVYYYGFNHPDIKTPKPIDHEQVIKTLNQLPGIKWVVDKKSFSHLLSITGTYDIGLAGYLRNNVIFDPVEFDTVAHQLVRRSFMGKPGFGAFVPLMKHLEAFSEIAETCEKIIKNATVDSAFKEFNELMIETLAEVERNGLAVDKKVFSKFFDISLIHSGFVYSQYNFYTSTGRPSNRFGGLNYAALNKEDGSRRSFISRFGDNGKLVLIDYSAFHPRIIALLTSYDLNPNVDIYEYLARLYFNKQIPDETDIADAKQITFRQLYGGVEEKYCHIKYLAHLKEFIDRNWSFFNQYGYVETPIFKRKITDKHLTGAKPATVFNYILQAAEGEISIPILGKVNEFLRDKKSKAILYTYDSVLFDYCLDDGPIMTEVRSIMSFGNTFPMKWYIGNNFQDMEQL